MNRRILYAMPFVPGLGIIAVLVLGARATGIDNPGINALSALWQAVSCGVTLCFFI